MLPLCEKTKAGRRQAQRRPAERHFSGCQGRMSHRAWPRPAIGDASGSQTFISSINSVGQAKENKPQDMEIGRLFVLSNFRLGFSYLQQQRFLHAYVKSTQLKSKSPISCRPLPHSILISVGVRESNLGDDSLLQLLRNKQKIDAVQDVNASLARDLTNAQWSRPEPLQKPPLESPCRRPAT